MSVSVSMPQLGESVTEGTVTRWLKREGDHVSADEPLLEVSTDKVDTEIPSPVSGILRGITVAEDETVAVGAELAVIDEDGAGDATAGSDVSTEQAMPAGSDVAAGQPVPGGQPVPAGQPVSFEQPLSFEQPAAYRQPYAEPAEPPAYRPPGYAEPPASQPSAYAEPPADQPSAYAEPTASQPSAYAEPPADRLSAYAEPTASQPSAYAAPPTPAVPGYAGPPGYQPPAFPAAPAPPAPGHPEAPGYQPPDYPHPPAPAPAAPAYAEPPGYQLPERAEHGEQAGLQAPHADAAQATTGTGPAQAEGAESPYVTPLVRKLAAEHGIDLGSVVGTGVGGRIRKQDVLDAARDLRGAAMPGPAPALPVPQAALAPVPAAFHAEPVGIGGQQPTAPPAEASRPSATPVSSAAAVSGPAAQRPPGRQEVTPSSLRGTTERLSRARQVIAQRMVESLQTSAQLTTVVEADVTSIARLRDRARAAFEATEGVKLSFLPFFAQATVEALKVHPKLNAVVDIANGTVTYHDAEHLGIAVDTDRGLMVPVIRNAGDLNIGGLARKIADLAQRTRAGQVSPDDLTGGTFTLTNTGSRGALFDTPIINLPQVGILGTGTVNKRAVVVDDPALGEVITVRSVVYLALTYDHRLVDGADAARFLVTIKNRLEEGAFEAELGL